MANVEDSTHNVLRNTANALAAIERGYQPIPLMSGNKIPRLGGWQKLRWENTPEGREDARAKFDAWADEGLGGLGVLLGAPSGGLIDIDLDHPKTMRLRDHFLPPTSARSGRASRPSSHYWYIAAPGTLQESRTFKLPTRPSADPGGEMIVEYRSTGGQTAIPDNVHPTGERYVWSGEAWGGEKGPAVVDGRVLLVQVALLGFCTLLVNYWPTRGGRHEAYLALAGGLLRVGDGVHPYWERNIGVVISAIADATGDEDGADTRVSEVVETTLKRLRTGGQASGFGKLAEILGDDVVKQARVILGEIESAAGLPPRTSGALSLDALTAAVKGHPAEASPAPKPSGPITPDELRARLGTAPPEGGDDAEAGARDPLAERVGTWQAVDLDPYLTGQTESISPTVLERDDGRALLYPGRLNMLYGPSEAAKSWLAMHTCIQLIRRGERVLYVDFEDEPVNAIERMKLLGATPDDLRVSFRYARPEEPLADMERTRWGEAYSTEIGLLNQRLFSELLEDHDPSLIVADGMTMLYGLHGLDSNNSVQTDVITSWLKRLTRNGRSTVLLIDHTAKNPQRGSLPIGSQHKVAMVQGTLLQTYPIRQPMPGAIGEIELLVLKDRPGKVRAISAKKGERAQLAATVTMDSTQSGVTTITLAAPDTTPPPSGPGTTATVDLATSRDAERAERALEENESILRLFNGDLDLGLTTAHFAEAFYGVKRMSGATSAQRAHLRKIVGRLVEEGSLRRVGDTRGTTYYLAAVPTLTPEDDANDAIRVDDEEADE